MAESFQKPDYVFDGNYASFPRTLKLFEHFFHTKQIQNKTIDPQGKVSLRCIYYFMLMSTCPDKHYISWNMRDVCDQNDVDRAGIQTLQERTRYRDMPSLYRLGGVMKISDVKEAESGRSRAADSD